MADDEKKERKVLIVASVGTKREPSAGNPVITFVAHDEGDENTKKGYETWGKDLVDMVILDARLDCEITHKVKGDQLTLRITQMFDVQGKPIRQTQRRSGGGGYGGTKSPEERTSIENQVRAYIITDLWKADKIPEDGPLVVKLKAWLNRMGEAAPAPAQAPTPAAKAEPKAPPPTQKVEPAKEKDPLVDKAMLNKLAQAATDHDYHPDLVGAIILRVFKVSKAIELKMSQAKELLRIMEAGEGKPAPEPEPEQIPF